MFFFVFFFGQRHLVPLLLFGPPFFLIIFFLSTTLLTGMTGISLQMQWPLTSQFHGIFLKESFFVTHLTPRPWANVMILTIWAKVGEKIVVFDLKQPFRHM
jgi:hypothetical protein